MANLDTAIKRFSGHQVMMPWRGIASLPDGAIAARDRQVVALLYSGILANAPPTTATLTGTISGATEADIVAGGKTIILTLTNDTWVASGATFNAERQAIIDGLDSAQSEAFGWNLQVRDTMAVTSVVRTSDTVVTITLAAFPLYDITANETITVTVPSSALENSLTDVTAVPNFDISFIAPPQTQVDFAGASDWLGRKKPKRKIIKFSDYDTQEARAAAIAAASIPIAHVEPTEEMYEEAFGDDDAIIKALFLIHTIH